MRRLEPDNAPRRFILLLDASSSMSQQMGLSSKGILVLEKSPWGYAIELAEAFLGVLQPEDSVSLDVFASKHENLIAPTHDFVAVAQRIQSLPAPDSRDAKKAHGYLTHLGQAMAEIVAGIESRGEYGDTVLIFSDGEYSLGGEGNKKEELDRLYPRLGAMGARTFLLLCQPGPTIWLWPHSEVGLPELVTVMGGTTIDPWGDLSRQFVVQMDSSKLVEAAGTAYRLARIRFLLEVEVLQTISKPRKITLELLDAKGHPRPDAELLYPHYLHPSPSGSTTAKSPSLTAGREPE